MVDGTPAAGRLPGNPLEGFHLTRCAHTGAKTLSSHAIGDHSSPDSYRPRYSSCPCTYGSHHVPRALKTQHTTVFDINVERGSNENATRFKN